MIKVYECPLPSCDFTEISVPDEAESQPGVLADIFGWGVMSQTAENDRLRKMEEKLTEHIHTHTMEDFAIALASANKRIDALEREVSNVS